MPDELSMEVHDIVQEAVIKITLKKKKYKKRINGCLRRPYNQHEKKRKQKAKEKKKIYLFKFRVPKNSKER